MATYKLMQDIEADDHILGPLTLRQFIFALIAIFMGYLCFLLATHHAAFLLVITGPPALFFGFFALPFGRDQPTEIWALGKLRFWFKPRIRLWNQSGVKELVTITVPKKVERVLTDGLSQREVKSRLTALASTIDSRGWAVKHVDPGTYAIHPSATSGSDRLLDITHLPQEVPTYEVHAADDILDSDNNPLARQFDDMITSSAVNKRQELIDQMNSPSVATPAMPNLSPIAVPEPIAPPANLWFMDDEQTAMLPAPMAAPETEEDRAAEAAIAARLKAQSTSKDLSYSHLRTIQPLGSQPATPDPAISDAAASDQTADDVADRSIDDSAQDASQVAKEPDSAMTAPPDPAILSLAQNNDLNVATLAREAHKNEEKREQDEVVISLH